MSYDKEAIAALADIEVVANYLGLETQKRGAYTFIRCPMHAQILGKPDSTIGNCILSKRGKKGFKCFACGAHGDVFDMVTAVTGCSSVEAFKLVGDLCGGSESFRKTGHEKKLQFLSAEDLELLGLSNTYSPETSDEGKLLYNISDEKLAETNEAGCMRKRNEYVLYQKKNRVNLRTLQRNAPKTYYALIERKAGEAAEKYRKAIEDCDSNYSTISKDIRILLSSDGKLNMKERLPEEVIAGIKKALKKKQKRAEHIRNEYQLLQKQI